jgi:hypothetical protein
MNGLFACCHLSNANEIISSRLSHEITHGLFRLQSTDMNMSTIHDNSCFVVSCLDSGLSLTTIRDATEIESDHELVKRNSIGKGNAQSYRTLITKRDGHILDDTDSDDVFVEVE